MRRFFVLAVLTGLLLSFGCGKDGGGDPKNVPGQPKDKPTGGAPDKQADKGASAPPIQP